MCFLKQSSSDFAKKAYQDIYVLKIVRKRSDGKYESPFRSSVWVKGRKKRVTNFDPNTTGSDAVNVGLHCYRTMDGASASLELGRDRKLFLAVIPNGSVYYENNKEFCANQMILLSEIKIPKTKK